MDDTLLADVEAFCTTHGLKDWQFGIQALNDPHFIRDLKNEREPRRKTIRRVREFMSTYSPPQVKAA